ncbi:DUF6896 domain-containing protein [Microbulbifer sp. 2201CG32-9]|uniref:DUF6896 domain-containing protein n=1 Tax=Microbulbifer sp. 2201CG32-9 TaxID=3232309 RepID=UPI00345C1DB9
MMIDENLKTVIDDYLGEVQKGINLFKSKIGDTPPLVAWRNKDIPQKGKLSDDVKYEFHGIGCVLIFPEYEVDFDFGPDNRSDGFDLWRLHLYVSNRAKKYPYFQDEKKLKKEFENAIEASAIAQLDHPYSNLYFYA